jgi:2-dehydropantoate 2-reductase
MWWSHPQHRSWDRPYFRHASEGIAADLAVSAFGVESVQDAMRWKYAKLLSNLGNAVEALCGDQPRTRDVRRQAVAEAEAALSAAGAGHITENEFAAAVNAGVQVCSVEGEVRDGGSSWQSLVRGRGSIETDFLNGEIVLLGREHDLATPVNEALQLLARRFAADHREAGSLPVAEL